MTARGRRRRHLWQLPLTALIGLASGVVVWVDVITIDPGISPLLLLLDVLLGLTSMVLVGLRDRAPVTIALLLCATAGFSVFDVAPWLLAVASLSTRRSLRLVALLLAATVASPPSRPARRNASGSRGRSTTKSATGSRSSPSMPGRWSTARGSPPSRYGMRPE